MPPACLKHTSACSGNVALWRDESHDLLAEAYPDANGGLLPIISDDFRRRSRAIADRRIVEGGYRLGGLLEIIFRPAGST